MSNFDRKKAVKTAFIVTAVLVWLGLAALVVYGMINKSVEHSPDHSGGESSLHKDDHDHEHDHDHDDENPCPGGKGHQHGDHWHCDEDGGDHLHRGEEDHDDEHDHEHVD